MGGNGCYVTLSNKRRLVVLHGHIFKNAGTSVDRLLDFNFGNSFIDHRDDAEMGAGGEEYLKSYIQRRPHIKALSSHRLPLPVISTNHMEFKTIVFYRNPIARVASVYRFERIQKSDTLGALSAKKYGFDDYVRWRLNERPGVISNYFVNYSTSSITDKLSLESRYEKARKLSIEYYLTGLVECFHESMSGIASELNRLGLNFKLKEVNENVTDPSLSPLETKIGKIRNQLGDKLYEQLLAANVFDLKLYESIRAANQCGSNHLSAGKQDCSE